MKTTTQENETTYKTKVLPDDLEFLKMRALYWETNLLEYLRQSSPEDVIACVVSMLANRDARDRYLPPNV